MADVNYHEFLDRKRSLAEKSGQIITIGDIHPILHHWQKELVQWAVRTSRAALWADTGMGKTVMQLEWARLSADTSLIVAPLAVCQQTVREAARLGIDAKYVRDGVDITGPGVWVTNYEMVSHFDPALIDAIALDESSILKQSDGKTRTMLIEHFRDVPHRLACSATPAPNDPEELTNQAEFLGRMSRTHMLAAYFVHDADGWRQKGHARGPMMRWMAEWAVALTRPSDMGGDDTGYILPGLEITPHLLPVEIVTDGQLFATELGGVQGRAEIRRKTLKARVEKAVELVHDCTVSAGSSGVHEGVLRREQGEVEAHSGGTRTEECPPAREVCERQGTPRQGEPSSSRVEEASPTSASIMDVWDGCGHDRETDRCGMLDMSCESACGSESSDAYRPRPQDGHGPWCTLPAMQPGIGAHGRRSDSDHGYVRLHHACLDQWLIWCGLNDEQDALVKALGDECRSIDGRTKLEDRVTINDAWIAGEFRILVVKPGMYSQGMNWQHCARMAFVGLSDSYESYYQAIRRCYRYGQKRIVHAHVILSDLESQIADNIRRKEQQASFITAQLVQEMQRNRTEGIMA